MRCWRWRRYCEADGHEFHEARGQQHGAPLRLGQQPGEGPLGAEIEGTAIGYAVVTFLAGISAEHTTDTHGQTLLTFALFDFVGLRLSPRIARLTRQRLWPHPSTPLASPVNASGLTRQRLWRPHPASHYQRWPSHRTKRVGGPCTRGVTAKSPDQDERLAGARWLVVSIA